MAQDTISPNVPGLDAGLAFKDANPVILAIAGAAYTAQLADVDKLLRFTGATGAILTIPNDADVEFPAGTVLNVQRGGTGAVQITGAAGVTVSRRSGVLDTIAGQHDFAGVMRTGPNAWTLVGSLTSA